MKQIVSLLKYFIFPTFHFSIERWKYNKDFGVYVSTFGNVKDADKQYKKQFTTHNGYLCVITCRGAINVHRLVLSTFLPNDNMNKLTVEHKDHNKRNNKLYNLEWLTREENLDRAQKDLLLEKNIKKNFHLSVDKHIIMCLRGKTLTFKNSQEAALYLIGKYKNLKNLKLKKIEENIIWAIVSRTVYYGRYWDIV